MTKALNSAYGSGSSQEDGFSSLRFSDQEEVSNEELAEDLSLSSSSSDQIFTKEDKIPDNKINRWKMIKDDKRFFKLNRTSSKASYSSQNMVEFDIKKLINAIMKKDFEMILNEYVTIPKASRYLIKKEMTEKNFNLISSLGIENDEILKLTFSGMTDSFESYSSFIINHAIKNKHITVILSLYEIIMKDKIKDISQQFQSIFNVKLEGILGKLFKKNIIVSYIFNKVALDPKIIQANLDFKNFFVNVKSLNEELYFSMLLKYQNERKKFSEESSKFYTEKGCSINELILNSKMEKSSIDIITLLNSIYMKQETFVARTIYRWSKSATHIIYLIYIILNSNEFEIHLYSNTYTKLYSIDLVKMLNSTLAPPYNILMTKYIEKCLK